MHLRCRNLDLVSGSRNASVYRAARTRVSVVKGSPDAYLATPFSSGRVRDSTDGLVPGNDAQDITHVAQDSNVKTARCSHTRRRTGAQALAPISSTQLNVGDSPFVIDNNRGGGFGRCITWLLAACVLLAVHPTTSSIRSIIVIAMLTSRSRHWAAPMQQSMLPLLRQQSPLYYSARAAVTSDHLLTAPPPPCAVGDRDKVRLHTVEYESDESAGKPPTSLSLKPPASSTPAPIHHPRALLPLLGHLA
ncbi:hypothetical protein HaLaN_30867 [Haematococcus lacustris]|uniref:Uncharacterized protein n=1 Tax=Haematococcus lacustris TaxID=44745 RepID=A0A6A0AHJ7_HAELA|nr:hypothetical protein HaLaN_30867 [Haematococcus lacustris]